jgi:hypothetical protein
MLQNHQMALCGISSKVERVASNHKIRLQDSYTALSCPYRLTDKPAGYGLAFGSANLSGGTNAAVAQLRQSKRFVNVRLLVQLQSAALFYGIVAYRLGNGLLIRIGRFDSFQSHLKECDILFVSSLHSTNGGAIAS